MFGGKALLATYVWEAQSSTGSFIAGLLRTFIMLMYMVTPLEGALLCSISNILTMLSSRSAHIDLQNTDT